MNARRQQLLAAIQDRIEVLKSQCPVWRGDARSKIQDFGFSVFLEVRHVEDRGCRAAFDRIHGRAAVDDAERMRFSRDITALEQAGLVRITHHGRIRYVQPIENPS